jgi:hypothetical protein
MVVVEKLMGYAEVLRANVKLTFSENFTLVTGYFEKDGRRGSILTGVKSSI